MMTVKLSVAQARAYFAIKAHGPVGPNELGVILKFEYEKASAMMTRPIKKLLKEGMIERVEKNKRVVQYVVSGDTPPMEIKGYDDFDDAEDVIYKGLLC